MKEEKKSEGKEFIYRCPISVCVCVNVEKDVSACIEMAKHSTIYTTQCLGVKSVACLCCLVVDSGGCSQRTNLRTNERTRTVVWWFSDEPESSGLSVLGPVSRLFRHVFI